MTLPKSLQRPLVAHQIRNLILREVGGTHLALRQIIICCDKQTVLDKAVASHIPTCLLNNMNFAYGANSSGNQLPCLREKQDFHLPSISARTLKTTL